MDIFIPSNTAERRENVALRRNDEGCTRDVGAVNSGAGTHEGRKARVGSADVSASRTPGTAIRCERLWNRLMWVIHFCLFLRSVVSISTRRQVVFDQLAVFHHEPNSLQLGNVGERVARHGDKIREPSRLN
jgi:hypothetical protein